MYGVVDGNAEDDGGSSDGDEWYRVLDKGYDAQGEQSTEGDGSQDHQNAAEIAVIV